MSVEIQEQTKQKKQEETSSIVENALVQFNDALKSQEKLNHHVNLRTSQFIQFGVFSVIVIAIGIGFLTWSLKQDMSKMSQYMETMAKDASTMSNAALSMQSSMRTMKRGMNTVVGHTESMSSAIVETDSSVAIMSNIAKSVRLMQGDVHSLNKSIGNMNYNLSTINKHMKNLNKKLGLMGQDVNRMSSPARMFPF